MANDQNFRNWLRDFFENFGLTPKPSVLEFWTDSLSAYPVEALKAAAKALGQSQQRGGGTLLPGALIAFLPNQLGHPSPEQAWNHVPKTEHDAGYVTREMMSALADCADSLNRGDYIGGRKAFLESYAGRVRAAEAERRSAVFFYSQPSDGSREQRLQLKETKIIEAVKNGWLTHENAKKSLALICEELSKPLPLALERITGIVTAVKIPADSGLLKIEKKSAETSVRKLDLIEAYGDIKAGIEEDHKREALEIAEREKALKERRKMLLAQAASVLGESRTLQ